EERVASGVTAPLAARLGAAFEPVALALPGVSGERDARGARGEEPLHRDLVTVHEGRPDVLEDGLSLRLVAPQRAGGDALDLGGAPRLLDRRDQDGVRADLDEVGEAVGEELLDRVPEADRLAQIVGPVAGVELGPGEGAAADGRVERDLGRPRGDRRHLGAQLAEERLDLRAVAGEIDLHAPAEDAARLELLR